MRSAAVRDPSGRRTDGAVFCTNLAVDATCVLTTYARGWTLEVTFHESTRHLGFGQAQSQAPRAVQRTAPVAGLLYNLVLLWAAAHVQQGGTLGWLMRPWYRTKTAPAFSDLLSGPRQELWRHRVSAPPSLARCPTKGTLHQLSLDLRAA